MRLMPDLQTKMVEVRRCGIGDGLKVFGKDSFVAEVNRPLNFQTMHQLMIVVSLDNTSSSIAQKFVLVQLQ